MSDIVTAAMTHAASAPHTTNVIWRDVMLATDQPIASQPPKNNQRKTCSACIESVIELIVGCASRGWPKKEMSSHATTTTRMTAQTQSPCVRV